MTTPLAFWLFLLAYGALMFRIAPRTTEHTGYYFGRDGQGRPATGFTLASSIFISWIFAKSVTNAANLGAEYGMVGGLAYATYWLSIPVAGYVIYRIRTTLGAGSLMQFIVEKYGRWAAVGFSLALVVRLYNEVWSNTAVVAAYFGAPGSSSFLGAALIFTLVTLAYSIKGGLRSALITDRVQAALFAVLLVLILMFFGPRAEWPMLLSSGSFTLSTGVDLLLVAVLQSFSYPFHDPVLTDRGFITDERSMLRSFIVAGVLGFIGIAAFSLIGVWSYTQGMTPTDNTPAALSRSFGLALALPMLLIMLSSAGSTLDSTFSSLARYFSLDLRRVLSHHQTGNDQRPWLGWRGGAMVMTAFAILGNIPLLTGTEILKATTISGTMVMGLAPSFLLYRLVGYSPASFHLSFWPGLAIGILHAADLLPEVAGIGNGKYAMLLGANAYGLIICTTGYLFPVILRSIAGRRTRRFAKA